MKFFQSEIFGTGKHILFFQMGSFIIFLTETFVLNLCNFNIVENANIVNCVLTKL